MFGALKNNVVEMDQESSTSLLSHDEKQQKYKSPSAVYVAFILAPVLFVISGLAIMDAILQRHQLDQKCFEHTNFYSASLQSIDMTFLRYYQLRP